MPDIGQLGPAHSAHPERTPAASASDGRDMPKPWNGSGRGLTGSSIEVPEDRHDRIACIRAAIQDGSYPSEEKLEIAMKRMIEELRG